MKKIYQYYEKLSNPEFLGWQENEFIFNLFFAGCWIKNNEVKLCIKNEPFVSYTLIGKETKFPLYNFNSLGKASKTASLYIPSNIKELIKYNRRNSLEKSPEKYLISKICNNIDMVISLLIL